ncbi:hypothetical protein JL722_5405 [Aureococcus anophagefferens]|nr:hypothetical protein JL722_5405 [Aureococcus anophagefferens]
MTFGAVGPAFYDFLVAHGVDDPFDTWFLLYIGWWVVFLLFFFGPLSWVVLRPPPTSAAAAVPPPATLSDDQAARLEAAAGGAAKVDGVFATDGRWFEVTVDWEGVPRAHASGARAAKKEEKLRFVARKAVELREALPAPVRGVNFAASLVAHGAVACYVPGAGTYDPARAGERRRDDADLLVAHVAALVGAAARDATEEDARDLGALRPTVDEFNGATLHAVHDQFAEHGMRKCYGSWLLGRAKDKRLPKPMMERPQLRTFLGWRTGAGRPPLGRRRAQT